MFGIGSLIGGAAGAVGSIFGGIKASQAMKKVKKNLNAQREANQNWFDRRYNEDATQRADAQRILTMTAENIKNRNRQAAGMAAVGGATEESLAATKAANSQALAEAASQIATAGEARKDNIENTYLQRDASIQDSLNNLEMNKANAITQAAQGFAQSMGTLGSAFDPTSLIKSSTENGKG